MRLAVLVSGLVSLMATSAMASHTCPQFADREFEIPYVIKASGKTGIYSVTLRFSKDGSAVTYHSTEGTPVTTTVDGKLGRIRMVYDNPVVGALWNENVDYMSRYHDIDLALQYSADPIFHALLGPVDMGSEPNQVGKDVLSCAMKLSLTLGELYTFRVNNWHNSAVRDNSEAVLAAADAPRLSNQQLR